MKRRLERSVEVRWAAGGETDRFADLLDDTLPFGHLTGQISSNAE